MLENFSLGGPEILILIAIPIALFFLFRFLNLWYWRINEMHDKVSRIIALMEKNLEMKKEDRRSAKGN